MKSIPIQKSVVARSSGIMRITPTTSEIHGLIQLVKIRSLQSQIEVISQTKGWHDGVTPIEVICHGHAELSEVFEELRKKEINKDAIGMELCDVLITVLDLASYLDVELEDYVEPTMQKISSRKKEKGLTKSCDTRTNAVG